MLRQFDLGFENKEIGGVGILPIKYNIQKRLSKLKYLSYNKIEIILMVDLKGVDIWWDDKRTANIKCYIDRNIINDLSAQENIILFSCPASPYPVIAYVSRQAMCAGRGHWASCYVCFN